MHQTTHQITHQTTHQITPNSRRHALPQVGRDYAARMRGKLVLETGNPLRNRDGEMVEAVRAKGTGLAR